MSASTRNCCGVLIGACVLVSGTAVCQVFDTAKSPERELGEAAGTSKTDAGARSATVGQQVWGTLTGRFALAGESPPFAEVEANAAQSVPQDNHTLCDESLLIDRKTMGIKNIAVFARKVSRVHESHTRLVADPVQLEQVKLAQKDCCYRPHVLAMHVGQLLRIKNGDSTPHIALVRPAQGVEDRREVNELLSPDAQMSFRFLRQVSKPLPVKCSFHPNMTAYVLPRNNFYFAVTDESGSFKITDLPAGEEIEFQVWHENAGGASGGLIAKPAWTKGRFRVTIPAGGVKDLGTIEVPSSAFEGGSRLARS